MNEQRKAFDLIKAAKSHSENCKFVCVRRVLRQVNLSGEISVCYAANDSAFL